MLVFVPWSSMTSLLSSFLIEPVFRQARRFSSATPKPSPQGTERSAEATLSHVNDSGQNGCAQSTEQQQNERAITDAQSSTTRRFGEAAFHRFVPPLSSEPPPTSPPLNEFHASELSTATNDDDMAIPPHANSLNGMRAGRTSTPRDIPHAAMSLREESPSTTSSLPADDGMRLLRHKIHSIRELHASQEEKARRMHDLMTEEWQASQAILRPQSPASMISQERTFRPSSPPSTITTPTSPSSTLSLPIDPQNPYNIQPEDLQPSYRPRNESDSPQDDSHDGSPLDPPEPILGCKHYKRNVKIQCHGCKEWHPCRHCHDASVSSHHLNRRATENMLCMLCWAPQPASQCCRECGERAAWYYCDICKLWDDAASKRIYHCAECGICRRGEGLGKDFIHCKVFTAPCHLCNDIARSADLKK